MRIDLSRKVVSGACQRPRRTSVGEVEDQRHGGVRGGWFSTKTFMFNSNVKLENTILAANVSSVH